MRRFVGIAVASIAAALSLAACGGPDVTAARIDNAIAPTFGRLYARQQALVGRSLPSTPQTSASCHRSGRDAPTTGAGSDWLCQLLLQVGTSLTQYTYELTVQATGCYTAEGPPGLVGQVTLTTRAGVTRVNPLFAFDGCFDSW
jgi:hypothetical protein